MAWRRIWAARSLALSRAELPLVAGASNPFFEDLAVLLQGVGKGGIVGEVADLVGVGVEVAELFGGFFVDVEKELGFDHALGAGPDGLLEGLAALDAAGVGVSGAGRNEIEACRSWRTERHGGAVVLHSLGNAVYPRALKGLDSGEVNVVELPCPLLIDLWLFPFPCPPPSRILAPAVRRGGHAMNWFWSLVLSAASVAAVVVLLVGRAPYGPALDRAPVHTGLPEPAVPPPLPPPSVPPAKVFSRFEMREGEELALELAGVVPDEVSKGRLLAAARSRTPELVSVVDRIEVDPAAEGAPWLDRAPDLVEALVAGTRDPVLAIGRDRAEIGGASDDERLLAGMRDAFESLVGDGANRKVLLRLDPLQPAPETRLPLVLYLGQVEGKYALEGSLPAAEQRRAVVAAAKEAVGPEKLADHLRVSPRTVDEPWMATLPALVGALLETGSGGMELIVVDRALTLKGAVPDEAARGKILGLAAPAREAGYAVLDELVVKRK